MIKNMNSKITTNSQHQQLNQKQKLSKQLEREHNHRNGDHLEGYQWGRGGGRGLSVGKGTGERGEKVQEIRNINGR